VGDVASATLRAAGVRRTAGDFLARSSVTPQLNSDLLVFSVTDPDPELSVKLASAYAREFTTYKQRLDTASLGKALSDVRQRIDELVVGGDRHSPLYQNLVEKESQLATLEALQTANASVVQPATKAIQVQPKPVRNGILGLALGIVLGIGFAFLWEGLDTRVRSVAEISERLGLPLLARIPEPERRASKKNRLVMLGDPRSQGAEAFRMLRTNLSFARLGRDIRTIALTSAVEEEGKSTTAANLAVALARAGQTVALVDLDLRRPFLGRFFALQNRPGLTQVAIGEATLQEALVSVPVGEFSNRAKDRLASRNGDPGIRGAQLPPLDGGKLRILLAGPVPPNAGEFAGSEALADILHELRERFDTVLIDAPPSLQVGDAMALSANVDALIVVTRLNVIRRPMLTELRRLLDGSPAAKLGFVVTGAKEEDSYGGYSGYGGYYGPRTRERVSTS
jgi:Mrp family chromosome partitioning ATPase